MDNFIDKIQKQLERMPETEKDAWILSQAKIYENDYYDYYGVCDPMRDLANAICSDRKENLERAEIMMKAGRGYFGADAAKLYRILVKKINVQNTSKIT